MRTRVDIFILCIFMLLTSAVADAQEVHYEQITEEDNLPSYTVYDILQDDEGYLWIATDFGVARYDGSFMEHIKLPEDLKDITIIRLYKDHRNRIWLLNYSGVLSYYEEGRVYMADRLNELTAPFVKHYIDHIYIDDKDRIWIAPLVGGVYVVDSSGINKYYPKRKSGTPFFCEYRKEWGSDWISIIGDTVASPEGSPAPAGPVSVFFEYGDYNLGPYRHVVMEGENVFVGLGKDLYHIVDGKIVDSLRFQNNIASLYLDDDHGLWVSEFFHGVHYYSEARLYAEAERFFDDMTISRVFRDREGNYWFTSTHNGIFLVKDLDLRIYPAGDDGTRYQVISLDGNGNRIFLGTYDQRVFSFDKGTRKLKELNLGNMSDYSFDILVDRHDHLWVASSQYQRYSLEGIPAPPDTLAPSHLFYELSDGTLISAATHIRAYQGSSLKYSTDPEPNVRISAIEEFGDGILYIGTRFGLYRNSDRTFNKLVEPDFLSGMRVLSLEKVQDKLLIGTSADGLLVMDTEETIVRSSDIKGLQNSMVRTIISIHDSLVFLGTNRGLYKLKAGTEDDLCEISYHYHHGNGLPTNDINDLYFDGVNLWVASDRGLWSLDPFLEKQKEKLPEFKIDRFMVNGQGIDMQEPLILEHDQNNIRIEFSGITFRGPQNLNFRYKLAGHDPEILYTDNNFVTYSNISPGDYTFFLNAGDIDGNFHAEPLSVQFTVEKHFTETLGFIILVSAVGLIILVVIGYLTFNLIHFKSVIRRDLLVTRHQLLRSQMNPHFLFNSLLAVQSFIYRNDPAEAARYLSSFSKLMRLTLNSSRKEIVTLEKELEYLRNYLDLQKVRFGGKFEYHIKVQDEIIPEKIAIPPLLAQPFIENAVEHGIRNIQYKGIITIRYSISNGELRYEIEDNGVGLFSEGSAPDDHDAREEPLGIMITRERIRLLRKLSKKKFFFRIEELKDEKGENRGTRVSFDIQYTNV